MHTCDMAAGPEATLLATALALLCLMDLGRTFFIKKNLAVALFLKKSLRKAKKPAGLNGRSGYR